MVVHYARMTKSYPNIAIQVTAYLGKQILPIGDDLCNWMSQEVLDEENIKLESNGLINVTQ